MLYNLADGVLMMEVSLPFAWSDGSVSLLSDEGSLRYCTTKKSLLTFGVLIISCMFPLLVSVYQFHNMLVIMFYTPSGIHRPDHHDTQINQLIS